MAEFKAWIECIESHNFDECVKEALIKAMTCTHFWGVFPPGFDFLKDALAYLGFDNLGLPEDEHREVLLAFGGTGVVVPGTNFRLRNMRGLLSVIEPIDGSEKATLPPNWKEAVFVMTDGRLTWIGKRVREDLIGKVDLSQYRDEGDGWALIR